MYPAVYDMFQVDHSHHTHRLSQHELTLQIIRKPEHKHTNSCLTISFRSLSSRPMIQINLSADTKQQL